MVRLEGIELAELGPAGLGEVELGRQALASPRCWVAVVAALRYASGMTHRGLESVVSAALATGLCDQSHLARDILRPDRWHTGRNPARVSGGAQTFEPMKDLLR